jgi:hypothetical protein
MSKPTLGTAKKPMKPELSHVFPEFGVNAAAQLLGTSAAWVRQLVKDGFLSREPNGLYRGDRVCRGYIRFLRDDDRRASRVQSATRLHDAKAELVAVQVQARSAQLVKEARQEAISTAEILIASVLSDMSALPARCTRDLPMRQKIEDEVELIRNGWVQKQALRSSGAAASATPKPKVRNPRRATTAPNKSKKSRPMGLTGLGLGAATAKSQPLVVAPKSKVHKMRRILKPILKAIL